MCKLFPTQKVASLYSVCSGERGRHGLLESHLTHADARKRNMEESMRSSNCFSLMLAAVLVLTFLVAAQTQVQSSMQAGTAAQGTLQNSQEAMPSVLMAVELSKPLDSKKAKDGDPVEAKTLQDMRAPNGADIPRGSRVIGHVTQVSAHIKEQPQAHLGFVFEKIITKSGQEFPLRGVLQAVSVPQGVVPNTGAGYGEGNAEQQGAGQGSSSQQQSGMTRPAASQNGGQGGSAMRGTAAGSSQGAENAGEAVMGAGAASAPGAPPTSGVTGLKDVQISPGPEPALTSNSRNIHLDSGSIVTLRVTPTQQ